MSKKRQLCSAHRGVDSGYTVPHLRITRFRSAVIEQSGEGWGVYVQDGGGGGMAVVDRGFPMQHARPPSLIRKDITLLMDFGAEPEI